MGRDVGVFVFLSKQVSPHRRHDRGHEAPLFLAQRTNFFSFLFYRTSHLTRSCTPPFPVPSYSVPQRLGFPLHFFFFFFFFFVSPSPFTNLFRSCFADRNTPPRWQFPIRFPSRPQLPVIFGHCLRASRHLTFAVQRPVQFRITEIASFCLAISEYLPPPLPLPI